MGWPFRAASGLAFDKEGRSTAHFGALIFTPEQDTKAPDGESVSIAADTLACVIDVTHTLGLNELRQAYARVAQAKTLKEVARCKGRDSYDDYLRRGLCARSGCAIRGTIGRASRLNQQTSSAHWLDMVVIAAHGLISYAVQFPGEPLSGQWMPPSEGALDNYIPATYVVTVIKPSGGYAFNQMMHIILAHLWIFSPGASLPDRADHQGRAKLRARP